MTEQYRAQFDAEIAFANGGGLRTEGFRLDIPARRSPTRRWPRSWSATSAC